MTDTIPAPPTKITAKHPDLWEAYGDLGAACAKAGPLDDRTRRIVKLALAVGNRSEGAVHSHVRRGIEEGLSPDALRHVALLAISTLGFARAMAALSWIDDILEKQNA